MKTTTIRRRPLCLQTRETRVEHRAIRNSADAALASDAGDPSDTGPDGRSRPLYIPTTGARLQARVTKFQSRKISDPGKQHLPDRERDWMTNATRDSMTKIRRRSSPAHAIACATRPDENSITSGFTSRSKSRYAILMSSKCEPALKAISRSSASDSST